MGSATQEIKDGDKVTKVTYSATKKAMQYTVIGDDIKNDFGFCKSSGEIAQLVQEAIEFFRTAANNCDAFDFDGLKDLQKAFEELNNDFEDLKSSLDQLHSAFMTDIDNVNAELELNFGHWIGFSASKKEATRTENS